MEKIAIIDICGTLFDSNTTFDYIDFVNKDNKKYLRFRSISKSFIFKSLLSLAYCCFGLDLLRFYMVWSLKGLSKRNLEEYAERFYVTYLEKRKNQDVINKIKNLHLPVILVSATLEPIAKIICKKLQANFYYSSTLEYDVFENSTGRIKDDLLGVKLDKLIQNNLFPPYWYVVSNDFTDLLLFQNSLNGIIVTKDKHFYKWSKMVTRKSLRNIEILCVE